MKNLSQDSKSPSRDLDLNMKYHENLNSYVLASTNLRCITEISVLIICVTVKVLWRENATQTNVTIHPQSTLIFNLINTFCGQGFDEDHIAALP
jgi:hypothetical protein